MANRMVRPDLPVGSPERTAFFGLLRGTFCEDWKAAEKLAEADRVAKGDLYFVRAGNAVKIGHTADVWRRLQNMQANNHEELDCILVLRGRGHEEPQWHQRFKHRHIRGEWFRWTPDVERVVLSARECAQLPGGSPSVRETE